MAQPMPDIVAKKKKKRRPADDLFGDPATVASGNTGQEASRGSVRGAGGRLMQAGESLGVAPNTAVGPNGRRFTFRPGGGATVPYGEIVGPDGTRTTMTGRNGDVITTRPGQLPVSTTQANFEARQAAANERARLQGGSFTRGVPDAAGGVNLAFEPTLGATSGAMWSDKRGAQPTPEVPARTSAPVRPPSDGDVVGFRNQAEAALKSGDPKQMQAALDWLKEQPGFAQDFRTRAVAAQLSHTPMPSSPIDEAIEKERRIFAVRRELKNKAEQGDRQEIADNIARIRPGDLGLDGLDAYGNPSKREQDAMNTLSQLQRAAKAHPESAPLIMRRIDALFDAREGGKAASVVEEARGQKEAKAAQMERLDVRLRDAKEDVDAAQTKVDRLHKRVEALIKERQSLMNPQVDKETGKQVGPLVAPYDQPRFDEIQAELNRMRSPGGEVSQAESELSRLEGAYRSVRTERMDFLQGGQGQTVPASTGAAVATPPAGAPPAAPGQRGTPPGAAGPTAGPGTITPDYGEAPGPPTPEIITPGYDVSLAGQMGTVALPPDMRQALTNAARADLEGSGEPFSEDDVQARADVLWKQQSPETPFWYGRNYWREDYPADAPLGVPSMVSSLVGSKLQKPTQTADGRMQWRSEGDNGKAWRVTKDKNGTWFFKIGEDDYEYSMDKQGRRWRTKLSSMKRERGWLSPSMAKRYLDEAARSLGVDADPEKIKELARRMSARVAQ